MIYKEIYPNIAHEENNTTIIFWLHGYDDQPLTSQIARVDPENLYRHVVLQGPIETANGSGWFSTNEYGEADDGSLLQTNELFTKTIRTYLDSVTEEPDSSADSVNRTNGKHKKYRVVFIGFSQGAAWLLYWFFNHGQSAITSLISHVDIVNVAGFLPISNLCNPKTWIAPHGFTCTYVGLHGENDDVVDIQLGRSAMKQIERLGIATQWMTTSDAHQFSDQIAENIHQYLAAQP